MHNTLLTQTCLLLTETEATNDEYGDGVRTWVAHVFDPMLKCRITPTSSDETEVDRDTRKSWFTLIIEDRAAGVLNALSKVTSDGVSYEVFGEPRVVRRRFDVSHVEASLRIIEG